jgi:hypothetical protein
MSLVLYNGDILLSNCRNVNISRRVLDHVYYGVSDAPVDKNNVVIIVQILGYSIIPYKQN